MTKQDQAKSSIISVFPSEEAFKEFCQESDNLSILKSILDFAFRHKVIDKADQQALCRFIRQYSMIVEEPVVEKHICFEDLLEKKKGLINFDLSVRALTCRINLLIDDCKIGLPKVTNSMLTRLKKEPADTLHKQNVLRTLSFWIGHERSDLEVNWNYDILVRLCGENKQTLNYRDGVRIGFILTGRGDIVSHDIMAWLKREVKQYIEKSISEYSYNRWGKVKSHDTTTLLVDFPKETSDSNPSAYRQCLRSAISLAHQIAIKWSLSQYFTKNRFLSIGIAAGKFGHLDNYLLPILSAKLPSDPVIRLTDYTHQCLLINDIRVILCEQPSEITLFNGETLSIWWIVGLWSTIYFDFVQELLTDDVLSNNADAEERLINLVWHSKGEENVKSGMYEPNAVTTFFKYPHDSLLGIELAKTLFYRRRFWEALEILRIISSIYPRHLNARTLRMVIYRILAIEAPTLSIAENLLRQALLESQYIKEHCDFQMEDFYCEYAVIYLARAMLTLKAFRNGQIRFQHKGDRQRTIGRIYSDLNQAEELFGMGMVFSPSGVRSIYLQLSAKILLAILKNDEAIFHNPEIPLDAPIEIIKQKTGEVQWQLGFMRDSFPRKRQIEFAVEMNQRSFTSYDDSVSLQAYRPTSIFCGAVSWWDMFPVRTVAVAKKTLELLNRSLDIARTMEEIGVCIYSYTRTYGEMLPADEFISHIEKGISMVQGFTGNDILEREDSEVINCPSDYSSMLMTLNC